jgi:hypothetical protein
MLSNEKLNNNRKLRVVNNPLRSKKNIHALGLSYICDFLKRAGFTILEVNTDPNHHFQLLADINEKTFLIAVRSACAPEVGRIDSSTLEKLERESEKLNAIPHFAGVSIAPVENKDMEVESVNSGQEFRIIFSGISAVGTSGVLTANG